MEAGLYIPEEVSVAVGMSGMPAAVTLRKRARRVVQVLDTWRIHDEWWREEISRQYYRLELDRGTVETVFQDLVSGEWYRQRY